MNATLPTQLMNAATCAAPEKRTSPLRAAGRAVWGPLCALGLMVPTAVLGFGNEGHQTVGAIADRLIAGSPAAKHVKKLLGDETLEHAATWADEVKHGPKTAETEAFAVRNKEHHNYHYTDVPVGLKKYAEGTPGTGVNDVVHVINRCIAVLESGKDSKEMTQKEALKVLVHLVGDIHQPLHVGAAYFDAQDKMVVPQTEAEAKKESDHGGNDIEFRSGVLHSYWDDKTVQHAMKLEKAKTVEEMAEALKKQEPADLKTGGALNTWSATWATEILPDAEKAHRDLSFGPLHAVTKTEFGKKKTVMLRTATTANAQAAKDYDEWSAKVVHDGLAKAGFRLAAVLKKIWPSE
ncbi:S1/P1 nuclease [Prosthecobacter sp.]|uniref:S1/P1 nuclease n=1 Tax=Prosthecobacter sp. TaxID=1965333 RepID=UPI003783A0D3